MKFNVGDKIVCKRNIGRPVNNGDICPVDAVDTVDRILSYVCVKGEIVASGYWSYVKYPDDFELYSAPKNGITTVRPRELVDEERIIELLDGMIQHVKLDIDIPGTWLEEFNEIVKTRIS